jgi:hypothetical protein
MSTSQLAEQEALNGPSLEKACECYSATLRSSTGSDARGPSSAARSARVSGPRELLSTTWCPASMASRAIALPICPLPMNPTVISRSPCRGEGHRDFDNAQRIARVDRLGGLIHEYGIAA